MNLSLVSDSIFIYSNIKIYWFQVKPKNLTNFSNRHVQKEGWIELIFTADVQYGVDTAFAAGILFSDWGSEAAEKVILKQIDHVASYEPGFFYKRELPCILALLSSVEVKLDGIIIDGYVTLGKAENPGLGMHLYESIDHAAPVIGVAKRAFNDTPDACQLLRGQSKIPLYVTSVGVPLDVAKSYITQMHGSYRLPTLLKKVDQLCRGGDAE